MDSIWETVKNKCLTNVEDKKSLEGIPKWAFWERLKRKRPVAYEALQWGMFAVAVGALAASFLR